MLELKNISKTFFPGTINEKKALRGVDLHMETGDFITTSVAMVRGNRHS